MNRVIEPDAVRRAVDRPPADTRAALRGRFVTAAQAAHRRYTVDWMTFTVHDLPDGVLTCPDPLVAADQRVETPLGRFECEVSGKFSKAG